MNNLKLNEPFEKVWFTSDLHLMHVNISGKERSSWKDGYRTFKNEYVMTDHLIDSINQYVKEDDHLFHLGDFAFKDSSKIADLRNRIICKNLYHINGNHDKNFDKFKNNFSGIGDLVDLSIGKEHFILCHYAMRVWKGSHRGYYHLYGHSHGSLEEIEWGKSMDVGVDNAYRIFNEYRPFNLTEILYLLSNKSIKFVDHHSNEKNV